jgi:hypothetical protein
MPKAKNYISTVNWHFAKEYIWLIRMLLQIFSFLHYFLATPVSAISFEQHAN